MKTIANRLDPVLASPRFLWFFGGIYLLTAILHEVFIPPWVQSITRLEQALVWLSIATMGGLAFWIIRQVVGLLKDNRRLQHQVIDDQKQIDELRLHKEAVFKLSRKFVEASDEADVIDQVLQLSIELIGASGASYVPLDERGKPITSFQKGNLPFPVVNEWVEYLALPEMRERCNTCQFHGQLSTTCPLLKGPFSEGGG